MIKLEVYKQSITLFKDINILVNKAPLKSNFSVKDQLLRASLSIPLNLSEGYMRSRGVFRRHINIAVGSSNEVMTLLEIVSNVYGVTSPRLHEEYQILTKQMMSLKKRLE